METKYPCLSEYCVWDSDRLQGPRVICSLEDARSQGALYITVQKERGERLLAYSLEAYLGQESSKRPDWMLVGKVRLATEREHWVVVLVDLKSGTGWRQALGQFEAVLPALGKGGEMGGEQHHQESRDLLPIGKDHLVVALVAGHVGKEMRKEQVRKKKRRPIQAPGFGDRARIQKVKHIIRWQRKQVLVVSPTARNRFKSLADFFAHIGAVPSSEK